MKKILEALHIILYVIGGIITFLVIILFFVIVMGFIVKHVINMERDEATLREWCFDTESPADVCEYYIP